MTKELPTVDSVNVFAAIDLALVLQHTGEGERAKALLDRSEAYLADNARGWDPMATGSQTLQIHALRGDKATALGAACARPSRPAGASCWRYYRDFDPDLASIRNEPEFKAVFADIERDMAQQRARLAARPKDAPLELSATPTS